MEDDLQKRILADIQKTGYPCELRTQANLQAAGWVVTGNSYYLDEDEGKGREIDIHASHNRHDHTQKPPICTWGLLAIEVKKSDKPWVVFSSSRHEFFDTGGYGLLNHMRNANCDLLPYDVIMRKHPSMRTSRLGRSAYVAFSAGEENPKVFGAVVSASKAAYAWHKGDRSNEALSETLDKNSIDVAFYTPVVVVEGRLFECYLDAQGRPVLTEVASIPFSLNYLSPAYEERTYLVDIVTAQAVRDYADKHLEWLTDMHEQIVRKVRG